MAKYHLQLSVSQWRNISVCSSMFIFDKFVSHCVSLDAVGFLDSLLCCDLRGEGI
eukprot:UN28157